MYLIFNKESVGINRINIYLHILKLYNCAISLNKYFNLKDLYDREKFTMWKIKAYLDLDDL